MESKCRNIYSLSLVQQWTLDKFCILPTVLSLGYPELYSFPPPSLNQNQGVLKKKALTSQ